MRVIAFILVLCCAGLAQAQVAVEWLGQGAGGGGEEYQTLRVTLDVPAAGADVGLRDARGGLMIMRRAEAGAARRVLLPLALVGEADLPAGKWPVQVHVAVTGETAPRIYLVEATREPAVVTDGKRVLTVAAARETAALQTLSTDQLSGRAVVVDDADVRNAPALCFAGLDAVYLSPSALAELTEARAHSFRAGGLMLLADGPLAPNIGSLAWGRIGSSDLWVWPADALTRRPRAVPVLERTIDRVTTTITGPAPALIQKALWVAPAALVLALLVRIFVGRGRPVLLATMLTVTLAAIASGAVVLLRQEAELTVERLSWSERRADEPFAETETYAGHASLFATTTTLRTPAGQAATPPLPVTQWPRQWFGLEATLRLDDLAVGSTERAHVLDLTVPARRVKQIFTRQYTAATRTHATNPQARWLIGGYVHDSPTPTGSGTIFTAWARTEPNVAALLAWYELRFDASKTYLIPQPGQSPATFIELSPAK